VTEETPSPAAPAPKGRTSAINPHVKLERRVAPLFAGFFYGFLALAATVWLFAQNGRIGALLVPTNALRDVGLGLGAGLLLAGACWALPSIWGTARELEKEFGWILGEQRKWEVIVLAVLSGFAEEFFFRGAMYAAAGPIVTTILFGALHWPVNWSFRMWPFLALAAGAVFAMEVRVTGGLLAPMITHAVVNGVNLWRITDKYRVWKE